MQEILLVVITAIVMEPITALTHRYIMHGALWTWHKSHHDRYGKAFELNDLFPIVFSAIAVLIFIAGTRYSFLTYIGIGITLYGFIYFLVHEIIIHSRFITIKNNNKIFHFWRFSHNVHHQYQEGPFGFIAPVTPKSLAKKAKDNPRDLIDRYPRRNKSLFSNSQ